MVVEGFGEGKGGLGRDMAGASAGKLVGVNEESSVGITGVQRQHPVVDKLLGALGLVAGGEQTTGAVREEASLKAGGLGVVIVAIAVTLRDVLQDDPPVALHVDGPGDLGVVHVAGAEISLGSNPVACVILAGPLAGAGVVTVVKALLLGLGDSVHEVIGALVGDVGVLLEEERVLGDLERDVVGGILLVHDTEGEVRALSALGGRLRVTVSIARGGVGSRMGGGGAIGGGAVVDWGVVNRGVMNQFVRPYQCRDEDEGACNLANITVTVRVT